MSAPPVDLPSDLTDSFLTLISDLHAARLVLSNAEFKRDEIDWEISNAKRKIARIAKEIRWLMGADVEGDR